MSNYGLMVVSHGSCGWLIEVASAWWPWVVGLQLLMVNGGTVGLQQAMVAGGAKDAFSMFRVTVDDGGVLVVMVCHRVTVVP